MDFIGFSLLGAALPNAHSALDRELIGRMNIRKFI
jgi:hypothetical protein